MAFRCGSLTAGLILLGIVAALIITYVVLHQKTKSNYLALAEYWVYLPGVQMPSQDEMMKIMIRDNPYSRRGLSPIGTSEGLVFSDVRLHAALVLRSKNPHIFRPDQFDENIKPSQESLDALRESKSLLKLRYASDIPLKDKRHLQFLVHAADAMAELGNGKIIFDVKARKLITREELMQVLKENFDATICSLHTDVIWKKSGRGGTVETRGLNKIGVAELKSGELELDQRVIATTVMTEAVKSLWDLGTLPETLEVKSFDDTFSILVEKVKDGMANVRILRVQEI